MNRQQITVFTTSTSLIYLSKNDVLLGGRLKQKINDVQFLHGCEVKVLRFERQNESFKKKGTSSESWIGKKIQIPMTSLYTEIHVLVRNRQFKRRTSTLQCMYMCELEVGFSPRIYCLFRILNVSTSRQTDVKKKNSIPSIKSITESNQSRKTT